MKRTGGQLIVDMLAANQVERVFCVPGESYLAVLDALHDADIKLTLARQEGGAAMMAEAWGKLTGKPGICMVTRGPGATNAAAGVHVAAQDSTPMILFIGQVGRDFREREAFQEVDFKQFFGGMAKWVAEIDDPARVPEFVARAFAIAQSGRPGPVVLSLPEDMLRETAEVPSIPVVHPVETYPGPVAMARFEDMLRAAKRPIAILGGSRWSAEAVDRFTRFSERFDMPTSVTFRRQMLFDHLHPNFAGDVGIGMNPDLRKRIDASDLVLMVGTRLSEIASQGYTLLQIPSPAQDVVHVHPDASELGKVYQPALAIHASPEAFCQALDGLEPDANGLMPWIGQAEEAHKSYHAWTDTPPQVPGAMQMGAVMQHLRDVLPDDAILANGAGNYATWIHRFYRFRRYGTQVAPTSGSMGYGLPGAVAAKLRHPDRTVVAFAGDGCFQMTGLEFATAVQEGAALIVLVIDNGMYGTIRMHQEMHYPGRISGTSLHNPDFAALAEACGGYGERVERSEDFAAAFARAKASGRPALLHLLTDPEAITVTTTLTAMRAKALENA